MTKKTPLYDVHVELNGKIVEYAGYFLPIQYSSIIDEHQAVRNNVGLFDVSHMGQIFIEGKNALKFINLLVCNDMTNLQINKIRYSPLLNDNGGIIDDLLVYKLEDEKYMLVVNASNKDKDYNWIISKQIDDVIVKDLSDNIAQIAIQGPNSEKVMRKLTDNLPEKYYSFLSDVLINNVSILISRTGYTGEDGYELYFDSDKAIEIYKLLLDAGKEYNITPCGLGCRDTLRLEASMPLYGHEMNEIISPFDTGLERFVKMEKEFFGKDSLKDNNKTRVGLKVIDKGIVREDSKIFVDDKEVGITTSGTFLPYLNGAYAMAIIDKDYSLIGSEVLCDVRNRKIKAEIVALPFYKR